MAQQRPHNPMLTGAYRPGTHEIPRLRQPKPPYRSWASFDPYADNVGCTPFVWPFSAPRRARSPHTPRQLGKFLLSRSHASHTPNGARPLHTCTKKRMIYRDEYNI